MKEQIFGSLAVTLLIAWLGASAFAMQSGDAQLFQRAGSLGIAAAVGIYGMVRQRAAGRAATLVECRVLLAESKMTSRLVELQHALLGSHSEPVSGSGPESETGANALETAASSVEQAKLALADADKGMFWREAFVLIASTIQWGFGDQLVSLTKCGAVLC